ncbi:MAG: class I SAM-dependent methyltransferase [Ignavibacteriales bacterium]|jgi:SAM-dependent MidA family methyltransferase
MSQLTQIIKSLIHKSGPITFDKFMEIALYHPEHGYYTSGKAEIGKGGDYYTSPCVHPAFGEVLNRFICRAYEVVNAPDFTVVEMGAGKGFLALDILDSLKRNNTELYERLRYSIIELSPNLQEEGKSTLKEHIHKIRWVNSLSDLESESVCGVFISNELVDSCPFHRARFKNGELLEILVTLKDGEFVQILDKPSSSVLKEYFEGYNLEFENEQEVEINLHPKEWLSDISRLLAQGLVLTIDYGYLASELFNPSRMRGTFMCFHKHTTNENPYVNIGEQDITAHVDFSNLIRVGESVGLSTTKYTTQGQFLVDWGILDIVERYSGEEKSSDISSQKNRMAIKNLFLPELMGDKFKVLVQEKNLGYGAKTFYPQSPFRISFQKGTDRYGFDI